MTCDSPKLECSLRKSRVTILGSDVNDLKMKLLSYFSQFATMNRNQIRQEGALYGNKWKLEGHIPDFFVILLFAGPAWTWTAGETEVIVITAHARLRGRVAPMRLSKTKIKGERIMKWKNDEGGSHKSSKNYVSFNICSNSAQLQEVLSFCPIHSDTNNKHNNEVIHLRLIMQLAKE